ncbi:C-X-C motif chemokine 13 [Ambystoma mexicanum]|uniref:C-X-C motif chemokine 13 n=1 Tax=Ambystoma mexicanum TaxID=8296 RepID=UPI0037E961E2
MDDYHLQYRVIIGLPQGTGQTIPLPAHFHLQQAPELMKYTSGFRDNREPMERFSGWRDAGSELEANDKSCSPILDWLNRVKGGVRQIMEEAGAVVQPGEDQSSGDIEFLGEANKLEAGSSSAILTGNWKLTHNYNLNIEQNRMKVSGALLVLSLLLLRQAGYGSGQVFEGIYAEQRCRCLRQTAAFISPTRYAGLQIIPSGTNCQRVEVIFTLTSGQMVCVAPEAKWLSKLLKKLQRKKRHH